MILKSKKDILIRAIILVCVSDRGFWEFEKLGGQIYSKERREQQRKKVYDFLKQKGYIDYMTDEEKYIFEQPVEGENSEHIASYRLQDEALSSLLWVLNLRDMPDWLTLSEEDYHPLLQVTPHNNLHNLIQSTNLRSEQEIALQTEVAMLWHWRAIEKGYVPKDGRRWSDCITEIFGDEYKKVLDQIPRSQQAPGDFLIGNKTVSSLNESEQAILDVVAYWRHYALEWVMGNEEWDEVSVDT